MKLMEKKIISVICIGTIFLFTILGSTNLMMNFHTIPNESPQAASINWTEYTIYIDNDASNNWASIAATKDWCTGAGTVGDPYVIQNVTILPSSPGPTIWIKNSRGVYFKIQNCTSQVMSENAFYGGITLSNSDHGEIIGNNCSDGAGEGIFMDDCDNMTIQDNILSGNGYSGILLSGLTGSCDENVISGNIMVNNTVLGVYLNFNNSQNLIENNLFDGLGSQNNAIAMSNYGDNNTISGNTFHNFLGNIIDYGYHGSGNIHNFNNIHGNTIIGGSNGIIFETDGMGNEIYDNSFTNLTYSGLWIEGDTDLRLQNTLVLNNHFSYCTTGILFERDSEDTLVQGNNINGSSFVGINLYTNSANNTVKKNTITYNRMGIWLQYSDETHPIINNTISSNTKYGIYGYLCENQTILDNVIQYNNISGIYLLNSEKNIIAGNIISESIQDGLSLSQSDENFISGNIIKENQKGILVNESNANTVVGNMINDNKAVGILLDSSDRTIIHDNLMGGNLVCIEKVDSDDTIEYDNLCIMIENNTGNNTSTNSGNNTLSFSSLLEALSNTEGIIIGGTGLGLGAIIVALLATKKKKKPKKKT